MRRMTTLSFLLATVGIAAQQRAPEIESITARDMRADLTFLASDSMAGRLTDTPQNAMAAEWIASRFERMGLKPVGDNGTYYQKYTLATATLGEGNAGRHRSVRNGLVPDPLQRQRYRGGIAGVRGLRDFLAGAQPRRLPRRRQGSDRGRARPRARGTGRKQPVRWRGDRAGGRPAAENIGRAGARRGRHHLRERRAQPSARRERSRAGNRPQPRRRLAAAAASHSALHARQLGRAGQDSRRSGLAARPETALSSHRRCSVRSKTSRNPPTPRAVSSRPASASARNSRRQ